jgi:hypothetical protein
MPVLMGMDQTTIKLISPRKHDLRGTIVQKISEVPEKGAIYGDLFVFSDKQIRDALDEANPAKTTIHLSNHAQNKKTAEQLYEKKKKVSGLHAKSLILSEERLTPMKKKPLLKKDAVAWIGSANLTEMGLDHNHELMLEVRGPLVQDIHAQHKKISRGLVSPEKRQIIKTTPEKVKIYNNKETDIVKSIINRLLRYPHDQETIKIATMSIDRDLQDPLIELAGNENKKIKLYLDGTCFNGMREWLHKFDDAGKKHNNVSSHVYNPYKDKTKDIRAFIQHMKAVIIRNDTDPNKQFVMVSTGNLNNKHIDLFTVHPTDYELAYGIEQKLLAVKKESILFGNINMKRAIEAQQPRSRKRKRVADDNKLLKNRPSKKVKKSLF